MFNRNQLKSSVAVQALAAPADTATESTEDTNLPNIDGDALAEHARALGAKAGKNTDAAIGLVCKAKEDWEGGPFKVLFGLKMDFTDEQLDEFAVPDSDTGNNPDEFKVYKEDAKGKRKLVQSNFYVNFADGTPAGQTLLSRIEWTERAGDKNMIKDDIPDDIRDMSSDERDVHLKFLNGRRGTIRKAYKKAMALYFKNAEVNAYPGVKCEPIWVKGKAPEDVDMDKGELPEVENTPEPIRVWLIPDKDKNGNPRPIAKHETFSISAFLRLNIGKAIEKGGTFQSLIESGATKKAPGGGANSNNGDGFVVKTLEKGVAVIAELHRWMEEITTASDKVEIGKLYKLLNTKDNDELIVAVVELRNALNVAIEETHANAKYLKVQQGQSGLTNEAMAKGQPKAA
jgi:hypothetical protein